MQDILNTAETEERALSEEEAQKFDELEKKIEKIDATLEAAQKAREIELNSSVGEKENEENFLRIKCLYYILLVSIE